jgi:hypothetical protein
MKEAVTPWFIARALIIVVTALSARTAYWGARAEFENQSPSWIFVAAIVGMGIFTVLFILTILRLNPLSWSRLWTAPSWSANPFDPRQPAQFFHLAGWCFVALGLSAALYVSLIGASNFFYLIPLSFGVGMLAGVKFSEGVFREQFEEN